MGELEVKLKTVLNNFLNRDFEISERQRRAIVKNVKDEASIMDRLTTNTHIYINWMETALQLWEREGPTKQPLILLLEILIEFNQNRIIFVLLHHNNIYKRTIHVINSINYTADCDIVRPYIKFLDAFTHTEFGRNWIAGSLDCWRNLFKIIDSQKYTDELSVFLKDLFLNVVDYSELFSLDLSKLVLSPLVSVCTKITQKPLQGIVEENLYNILLPTIRLLFSVIKCISENVTLDNRWLKHCNNLLCLQNPLTTLLETVKGEEFTFELSRLLIAISFLEIKKHSSRTRNFVHFFLDSSMKVVDVNITRKFLKNITLLSYHIQHFWYNICKLIDVAKMDLPYDFSLSVIMFQASILSGIAITILGERVIDVVEKDEIRDNFFNKVTKKINKSMLTQMYKYRDVLVKHPNFTAEAHLTLEYISKSLHLYDKEGKMFVFNILVFFIGDLITDIYKRKSVTSEYYDKSVVIHYISTFIYFVDHCDITWKDVMAHMLVLDTVLDLILFPELPEDVVAAALKMLDVAIAKQMAPDLMLLLDCKSMISIGGLLESKLKSENEEIRCAASKVLVTVSENAKSSYPCFQKVLLDRQLPQKLLDRIFTNETVDVRVNAFKCLQHLVKIDSIWSIISAVPDILNIITNSLKTQTENKLRSETVNLVTVFYEEDYYDARQIKDLYEIMTRLGVHDFDVEVRINSLKFWEVVINKFLVEEGMIDGEFPEVTFSKTSRKIVVLDEAEVQRRLRRLLDKLSNNGCLTVLNSCFSTNEKSEKQCVDKIINNLLKILENYDLNEDNVDLSHNKSPSMSCSSSSKSFILDDLDPEILSPKDFLENVTQTSEDSDESSSVRKLIKTLDEVLRHNNLDEFDTMDSYL